MTGVTGGSDSTANRWLSGNTLNPTVNWVDPSGELGFETTIYEADGTTVKCVMETSAQDATSEAFA